MKISMEEEMSEGKDWIIITKKKEKRIYYVATLVTKCKFEKRVEKLKFSTTRIAGGNLLNLWDCTSNHLIYDS